MFKSSVLLDCEFYAGIKQDLTGPMNLLSNRTADQSDQLYNYSFRMTNSFVITTQLAVMLNFFLKNNCKMIVLQGISTQLAFTK